MIRSTGWLSFVVTACPRAKIFLDGVRSVFVKGEYDGEGVSSWPGRLQEDARFCGLVIVSLG